MLFALGVVGGHALANPCLGLVGGRFSTGARIIEERLRKDPSEIAIETEWPLAKALMMVDTTDGTVGALLSKVTGLPVNSQGQTIAGSARFRDLSLADRILVFEHIIAHHNPPIQEDRAYNGLHFLPEVTFARGESFTLGGKACAAGGCTFPLRQVFQDNLRYDIADNPADKGYVESSIRGKYVAGDLNLSLWRLEDALGVGRRSHHLHTPRKIPVDWISVDPVPRAAEMADFFVRANYAAEFTTIVDRGRSINISQRDGVTTFGTLLPDQIPMVMHYLIDYSAGQRYELGGTVKMARVAFRSHELYDGEGMMGLEFKSADRAGPEPVVGELASTLQYWSQHFPKGVNRSGFQKWWTMQERNGSSEVDLTNKFHAAYKVQEGWYNQPWESLLVAFEGRTRVILSPSFRKAMQEHETRGLELKMLFFDWSKTSLVGIDPVWAAKIQVKQAEIVTRGNKAGHIDSGAVREFLRETQIVERFSQSLVVPL